MLVQHVVVEPCVTNREAGKLPGVAVGVSAALDGRCDQAEVEQLLVEIAGVAAKVTDQVANLRSDRGVLMHDQVLQISIDVRVMDVLVEIFRDSGELGDQR